MLKHRNPSLVIPALTMSRSVLLSATRSILLLMAMITAQPAYAVIFYDTADSAFNTTAPGGSLSGSGWQWVGSWGDFQGTPVGPRHFLAARHIGGTVGDLFVLNGVSYRTVGFHDDATTDLRLWRIRESFGSWAPLYRGSIEVGRSVVLFGRGFLRGPEVRVGGVLKGWRYASSDGRLRWGQNTVTSLSNGGAPWGQVLKAGFDAGGGGNEATLATGDSSGPVFLQDGSTWKLAGVAAYVDAFFNTQSSGTGFLAALFDARALYAGALEGPWTLVTATQPVPSSFYATRVSVRAAWIDEVLSAAAPPNPPIVTTQPTNAVGVEGTTVSFAVVVDGTPPLSYQWFKDGTALSLETGNTLTVKSLAKSSGGLYHVTVANAAGSVISNSASLSVVGPSRLINVSVRARAGVGADTLIVGVTSIAVVARKLLVRAIGPGLMPFGVSDALVDPRLVVYRGNEIAAENENWSGSAILAAAFSQVGAFSLSATSKDAALLTLLPAGNFTVHVNYAGGPSGIALLEVYDAEPSSASPSLFNLSARNRVNSADGPLIAGFVLSGEAPQRVLVRGIGPGLRRFGLNDVLEDPRLELHRNGVRIAENDTWGGTQGLKDLFSQLGAFALDSGSTDAAVDVTLSPGAYTVHLAGAAGSTGVAIVEVYAVP